MEGFSCVFGEARHRVPHRSGKKDGARDGTAPAAHRPPGPRRRTNGQRAQFGWDLNVWSFPWTGGGKIGNPGVLRKRVGVRSVPVRQAAGAERWPSAEPGGGMTAGDAGGTLPSLGFQSDVSTTAGTVNTDPTGRDVAARFLDGLHRSHLFLIAAFVCNAPLTGVKPNSLASKRGTLQNNSQCRKPHSMPAKIGCADCGGGRRVCAVCRMNSL